MPEVSLVAILDADKEGFLRSDKSLIQTMGRAARNLNGKAILYADRITGSMQRAMDETQRRRKKQQEYNLLNNITPQALDKPITDIMDIGEGNSIDLGNKVKLRKVAEAEKKYKSMTATQLMGKITELEKAMFEAARELEFEKAANLRDQIELFREQSVKLS